MSAPTRRAAAPRIVTLPQPEHEDWTPRNIEAERQVLGAMLTDAECIRLAQGAGLTDSLMHSTRHRLICRAVLDGAESGASLLEVSSALDLRGELQQVGGNAYLAGLMEYATAAANVAANVRLLVQAKQQRDTIEAGRKLVDLGRSPGTTPLAESLAQHAAEVQALAQGGAVAASPSEAVRRFDAEATPDERPESLLGDGLLCRGDLAVLAGKPGLGKSRLAMELAQACARGEPWLGLPTCAQPIRVGYVAAEFSRYRWWQRCVTMFGGGATGTPDDPLELQREFRALEMSRDGGAFLGVTHDTLGEPLDLLSETGALWLLRFAQEYRLDLVVLDPLARLMGGAEESNEVLGRLVAKLDRVKLRTRAALLLLHHERKSGTDRGAKDTDPLDAIRGGSVLTGAANSVLRISRAPGGLVRLEFPKANYARTPEDMWLTVPPDGGRTVLGEAPEAKGDANRQRVLTWALEQRRAVTAGQAADALGLSTPTCRDHLQALAQSGRLEQHEGPRRSQTFVVRGESGKEEKTELSFS